MRRLLRIALCIGILAPTMANAAYAWLNDLTISEIRRSVSADGSSFIVQVIVNEPVSTGCSYGDTNRVFAHSAVYTNGYAVGYGESMLSALMYADAQGRTIDIQYDNANCSGTLGRGLGGVSINPAP